MLTVCAQTVEHHHTHRVLDGRGEAGAPEDRAQAIEAQLMPQRIEGPDITQTKGRLEAHLGITTSSHGPTLGAQQAIEKRVDLAVALIDTPQGGHRALPRLAVFIAERLDELRVGAFAGSGELDEHGGSVASTLYHANTISQ